MAKYWCQICRVFVVDSKFARAEHERSSKHRNAVARTISDIQQQSAQREQQSRMATETLRKIDAELGFKLREDADASAKAQTDSAPTYSRTQPASSAGPSLAPLVVKRTAVSKVTKKGPPKLGDLGPGYSIPPSHQNDEPWIPGHDSGGSRDPETEHEHEHDHDRNHDPAAADQMSTVFQAMIDRRSKNQRIKDPSENWKPTQKTYKPQLDLKDLPLAGKQLEQELRAEPATITTKSESPGAIKPEPNDSNDSNDSNDHPGPPASSIFKKRKAGSATKKIRDI